MFGTFKSRRIEVAALVAILAHAAVISVAGFGLA